MSRQVTLTIDCLINLKNSLLEEIKEQNTNLLQLHAWKQDHQSPGSSRSLPFWRRIDPEPLGVYRVSKVNFSLNYNNEVIFIDHVKSERVGIMEKEPSIGIVLVEETAIFVNGSFIMTYGQLCEALL